VGHRARSAAAPAVLRSFRRVPHTTASPTKKWRRCLSSRHSAPSLSHRRVRPGRAVSDGSTARARGRRRSDRQAISILGYLASGKSRGSRCRIYERIAAQCRRTVQPKTERGKSFSRESPPSARGSALAGQPQAVLLLETSDTLDKIAARLGFADASNSSRTFRGIDGIAPGEFRREKQSY
jgi:hypothetical protein